MESSSTELPIFFQRIIMKLSVRCLCLMLMAASFLTGDDATAQPAACPGLNVTVFNNTSATVDVCLATTAGPLCTGTIASGGSVNVAIPAGTIVGGIRSLSNINYPWQPNPAPPPAWRMQSVRLGTGSACFDLFFDDATCTVAVVNVGGGTCARP